MSTPAIETPTRAPQAADANLPAWARELVDLYESGASSQFIIYGNVNDRMLVSDGVNGQTRIGTLGDFLLHVLMPRFDVVLSYDLGNGIRVEKGGDKFCTWPALKDNPELPKSPRAAVETLTHYFRYCANLGRVNRQTVQVGCFIRSADLLAPALQGGFDYDLSALATLVRDWANDSLLASHALATFLITENLNDLHPIIANNVRTARIKIALPAPEELSRALAILAPSCPVALSEYVNALPAMAGQLAGSTLGAIDSLLKAREYTRQKLMPEHLVTLKKQIVERDCNGLIEFIESRRTLDDLYGLEKIKAWLRQDITLWKNDDLNALPKGYLICGPVGTGKTFLVECLAGEAGVPVVKMRNFRDKWVGSSEGNLEKIFRLIQGLGRCYVFIDEADQALGRRESDSGDSGISGRIYSMIAEEMGSSASRGRIIWVLASSRPDLIEVDLKRPGRVDVKIPLFPTTNARESFDLIRSLCQRRGLPIEEGAFPALEPTLPLLLTPGAAEALAVKAYRRMRTGNEQPLEALSASLVGYQTPVAPQVMRFQIEAAVREASDLDFVPACFMASPSTVISG